MKVRKGKYMGVVLHHTTGSEKQTLQDLKNVAKAKGYGDVSYNYLIKRDISTNQASIKTGRSTYWVGAHTYIDSLTRAKKDPLAQGNQNYYNENFLGVALIGNYETNRINDWYLEQVIKALAHIIQTINTKQNQRVKYFKCHRDTDATACPGKYVYEKMDYIREKVSSIVGYKLLK